ncbi:STAS domain-containing protein [Kitasatospora sp. NPDC001539]|uniref:STAS domain-containing protein n=1 Tax=unclassified Kitasatospora TaxID=2633591 RepID=UPI00331D8B7A
MTVPRNRAGTRCRAGLVLVGPDLRIEISDVDAVVVCSLAGDLHLDNEKHVEGALDRALDGAPALLAVDLSGVGLFTPSGLNALLAARRRASGYGVPLVVVAPSRTVERVLRITDADLVLPVYPSLERAVRHQRRSAAG